MRLDVETPAGPRPAYAYTGGKPLEAGLPAIVFIHGAMHDHSVWTLLARWFAHHGHAVLAPDLPGHSQSTGAPLDSVEAIADWVLRLLDAAGLDEVALVGHSMGSLIALEAAERDPYAAIDSVNALSISSLAGKPSYPGPGTWLHGANRILSRRLQAAQREANLFLTDFLVCDRYRGGLEAAARVTCPTTLVLGTRDQMTTPKQTAGLVEALRAQVVTLPVGHSLMTEAPDALLAAVRAAVVPDSPPPGR